MRFKKDFQGTITLPMTEANVMFFELLKWQAIFFKSRHLGNIHAAQL